MTQGRKIGVLPYGNGCELFPDCFTCPTPDCVMPYGVNRKTQRLLAHLWKPCVERELSKVSTLGGKG